jgi:hypothetical protein
VDAWLGVDVRAQPRDVLRHRLDELARRIEQQGLILVVVRLEPRASVVAAELAQEQQQLWLEPGKGHGGGHHHKSRASFEHVFYTVPCSKGRSNNYAANPLGMGG